MAHLIAASVEVKGDVAEEGNGNENNGDLKWKRKVSQKYLDNCYDVDPGDEPKKAKQDKDKMGVDVGLLKKNRNARLTSNKQDEEAKRGAMEQMLKSWKEKISCERCDSLQKELKELKETLNDKEESRIARGQDKKPLPPPDDLVIRQRENVLFLNPNTGVYQQSREARNVYYHPWRTCIAPHFKALIPSQHINVDREILNKFVDCHHAHIEREFGLSFQ